VGGPVRLHVAAKRYLCTVEPAYTAALSAASRLSLGLQGGPFTAAEVSEFEQDPWSGAAVAVRRWDDAAKVPGLTVPGLEHYRPRLEAVLLPRDER
jgi:gamma-butyrobetaine dioxygenase